MRIVQLPTGEYYVVKNSNRGLGAFVFTPKFQDKSKGGFIRFGGVSVPRELVGKRIMFRVEIQELKKRRR